MLQGIDQLSLLLVGQEPAVDAHLFFYDFIRLLQEIVLKLKAAKIATKRFQLLFQLGPFWARWRLFRAFHGC